MYSVTKKYEFDAAHRLPNHKGLCKNIHGHRYAAEVMFEREELARPDLMVVDFGVLKTEVKVWIDKYWDHSILLANTDPLVTVVLDMGFRYYLFPYSPTAEVMAQELSDKIEEIIAPSHNSEAFKGVRLARVTIYETPGSRADYVPGPTEVSDVQD